ncbi:MAG: MerR family transcriptional regulator [Gammaproteobacteria bacterium]|nr:MerR family transcriptional regulator [Gammaproteobacteria bacterium]
MYIGNVVKKTGASAKAIRIYDEMGLLPGVSRSGQYRIFTELDVQLVGLIKQAQKLGFTLAEIRQMMTLNRSEAPWVGVLDMMEKKILSIDAEVTCLQNKRAALLQYQRDIRKCLASHPECKLTDKNT